MDPLGARCSRCVDVPCGGRDSACTDSPGRREYILVKKDVSADEGEGGRDDSSVSR